MRAFKAGAYAGATLFRERTSAPTERSARLRRKIRPHSEDGSAKTGDENYTCGSASFSVGASSTLRTAQRAMTISLFCAPTTSVMVSSFSLVTVP